MTSLTSAFYSFYSSIYLTRHNLLRGCSIWMQFKVVILQLLPRFGGRKLLHESTDRRALRLGIVVTVDLAGMKGFSRSIVRKIQPVQDTIARRFQIVRVLMIVQHHCGHIHIPRSIKGQVMPLDIAIKLVHARDDSHTLTHLLVSVSRLEEEFVAVVHFTPATKTCRVTREKLGELFIAGRRLIMVIQVKSSHDIVKPEENEKTSQNQ